MSSMCVMHKEREYSSRATLTGWIGERIFPKLIALRQRQHSLFHLRKTFWAILIAVGAPFLFADAKHRRKRGTFFELNNGNGFWATPGNTVSRRVTKYRLIASK